MKFWKRFFKETDAATAAEYAVMLGLILVAIIASINSVGGTNDNMWSNNESQISNAMDNATSS